MSRFLPETENECAAEGAYNMRRKLRQVAACCERDGLRGDGIARLRRL